MTVLYLQCNMGASGDMLTAALASLLPDVRPFLDAVNGMGLSGVRTSLKQSESLGMAGLHAEVLIGGEEEEAHDHDHAEHHHDHDHGHGGHRCHHASLEDIRTMIAGLGLPEDVKSEVSQVYARIAQAEAEAHGTSPGEVHFHEVGMKDAVADVAAVCLLMKMLAPSKVVVSPVCVGSGSTRTAHGFLPVPAPATANLLKGVPVYGSAFPGELCTPTGAALLAHFADAFGPMPAMTVVRSGCGLGTRVFPEPNCLRAVLGEEAAGANDEVTELEANIDDMTPEALSFAQTMLLEAGALDAWVTPIIMKKGRAANKLSALCRAKDAEALAGVFFRHTTTLGVRMCEKRRLTLKREELSRETPFGSVRVKRSSGFGVMREKAEFDDLAFAARANGCSLDEVRDAVRKA